MNLITQPTTGLFIILMSITGAIQAERIVVDTVSDPGAPGECSLRDAIKSANEDPLDLPSADSSCESGNGPDEIVFTDVPGFGVTPVLLDLVEGLPPITSQVTINASIPETRTLPGNPDRRPGVVIQPATIPAFKVVPGFGVLPVWPNGFYLQGPSASGSEIRGIVIINSGRTSNGCLSPFFNPNPMDATTPDVKFCGVGVLVFGANNTTIAGNYIGVDQNGLQLPPIPAPIPRFDVAADASTTAIHIIDGSNTVIGGDHPNDRNVTRSARVAFGPVSPAAIRIDLFGWAKPAFGAPKATNHNRILGNYINVDAEGSQIDISTYGIWHFSETWPDDTFGSGRYGWGPECVTSDTEGPDHCEMMGTEIRGNHIVSNATHLDFYGYSRDVVVEDNIFTTTPRRAFTYILTVADTPGSRQTPSPGVPVISQ